MIVPQLLIMSEDSAPGDCLCTVSRAILNKDWQFAGLICSPGSLFKSEHLATELRIFRQNPSRTHTKLLFLLPIFLAISYSMMSDNFHMQIIPSRLTRQREIQVFGEFLV